MSYDPVKEGTEEKLWLMLLGAMLVSTPRRDDVVNSLDLGDVPTQHAELFKALKSGQSLDVRAAMVKYCSIQANENCFEGMLRVVRELALMRFCSYARTSVEVAKAVTPEQLLHMLDSLSTKIRCKQAALENSKTPAG